MENILVYQVVLKGADGGIIESTMLFHNKETAFQFSFVFAQMIREDQKIPEDDISAFGVEIRELTLIQQGSMIRDIEENFKNLPVQKLNKENFIC
jgi:hypothetical protein